MLVSASHPYPKVVWTELRSFLSGYEVLWFLDVIVWRACAATIGRGYWVLEAEVIGWRSLMCSDNSQSLVSAKF